MTGKIHHFEDGEFGINVSTELQPNGEYCAIDADNYDGPGSAMGWGFSQLSAIADLFEKLPRAASDREDCDRNAARADHAISLRREAYNG